MNDIQENVSRIREEIALGQRISDFTVEALRDGQWTEVARETTVGHKRIVLLPQLDCPALRITVTGALAKPLLSGIGLYQDNI